jgi:hypothetical protein
MAHKTLTAKEAIELLNRPGVTVQAKTDGEWFTVEVHDSMVLRESSDYDDPLTPLELVTAEWRQVIESAKHTEFTHVTVNSDGNRCASVELSRDFGYGEKIRVTVESIEDESKPNTPIQYVTSASYGYPVTMSLSVPNRVPQPAKQPDGVTVLNTGPVLRTSWDGVIQTYANVSVMHDGNLYTGQLRHMDLSSPATAYQAHSTDGVKPIACSVTRVDCDDSYNPAGPYGNNYAR